MPDKKALYSNRCWVNGKLQPATIYIEKDKISKVILGKPAQPVTDLVDYGQLVIMPGVIDAHVHINDPGRTEWEGFETATKAAAAGGITTLIDMPLNSSPVTVNVAAFQQKIKQGLLSKFYVNCGLYGGLVPDNLEDLEDLIKSGVLGIKCFLTHSGIDEFPNVGKKELELAMPVIAKYKIPMLVHCEWTDKPAEKPDFPDTGSYPQYLASRPKRWENEAVALMVGLCEKHQCRTHIVHVASAEALPIISGGKKKGLPLTAETCPHYIYFHAEGIPDNHTLYKCAPPIREKANNQQLKEAFKTGILDFIASDHSPAPPDLKELDSGNLMKAWGGISSLQYLLSAAWTSLKDDLTLETFIPLVTEKPAQFLNIQNQKGFLKKDMDADLTIWSPEESFVISKSQNLHKHKISPYTGETLSGKVAVTYVNGREVFNGKILDQLVGKWLLKEY